MPSGTNVSPAFTVVSPKFTATGGKAKASSISPTTPKLTAEQKKELREAAKNLTAERKRVKDLKKKETDEKDKDKRASLTKGALRTGIPMAPLPDVNIKGTSTFDPNRPECPTKKEVTRAKQYISFCVAASIKQGGTNTDNTQKLAAAEIYKNHVGYFLDAKAGNLKLSCISFFYKCIHLYIYIYI